MKIDIRKLDLPQLIEVLEGMKERKFRAKQIFEWLWKKSARSFEEMTNLSKDLRVKLEKSFVINAIQLDMSQKSVDGTIKSRFKLHDGHLIEAVLIPFGERYTVCVSSQVGCSLTCSFCATGRMKRMRNLDAAEIYDQVAMVNEQALATYGKPLSNVVYMGMGEPLLAYKEVKRSVEYVTAHYGLGMAPRRVTISTAGIAKMIKTMADDDLKVNLAVSLHAADDAKRNEIMPINETNTLEKLIDSLQYFYQQTKNKITFEYIAFQRFNDNISDAQNLIKICRQVPSKVNIIEYNPIDNAPFEKSDEYRLDEFAKYLRDRQVVVTVRRSRGRDIDAACGQLANKE